MKRGLSVGASARACGFALGTAVWVAGTGWALAADEVPSAVLAPTLLVSEDSEGLLIRKVGTGIAPVFRDGNDAVVLKAQNQRYSAGDWSQEASQLTLGRIRMDAASGLGYQGQAGLSDLAGRQLVVGDLDYSRAVSVSVNAGLVVQRDWVETRNALNAGIFHTLAGASLEVRPAPRWAVIAYVAGQQFSDDNRRDHVRLRLVYDLLPEQGFNLQYRHRHFWDSREPTGAYFNPDVYAEDMVTLGMRRRVNGWVWVGTLGLGQQNVSKDPATTTHLAELGVTSPVRGRIFFRGRVGYSDSAAFEGPDYRYRYLQADLYFVF